MADNILPSPLELPSAAQQQPASPVIPPEIHTQEPVAPMGGEVNVLSPDGELGSIPSEYLQEAIENGYQPASDEHVAQFEKTKKYGTTGQQIKTGLEGAASAASFGLSTGLETGLGLATPEDIQARREENPASHMVGQIGGILATVPMGGAGAAGILGKAGAIGAEAVGLAEAVTPLAKIGSAAVKGAIENALFQSGDEFSKGFSKDPAQNVQTAITDVGLAALIGGGIGGGVGAVSPLWTATMGNKVGGVLKAMSDKMGGAEGASTIPNAMDHAIQTSGMELAPEIRAGLSNDPEIQGLFKTLEQSDTTSSGMKLQEANTKFREDAGNTMVRALGREPEAVGIQELSKYEHGKSIGKTLADEYHAQVDPLAKEYEALREKTKGANLIPDRTTTTAPDYSNPYQPSSGKVVTEPGTVSQISDKIMQKAQTEGWTALPDSDIMREINKVMKSLPEQKTLQDLTRFTDAVGAQMQRDRLTNGPLFRAGGIIKGILRDAEADVMGSELRVKAPLTLERYAAVRKAYGEQAGIKEALDSRLHAGGSTANYAKSLREMASTDGERVLQRLSGANDADVLNLLKDKFPKTAELVRNYHVDNIIKNAMDKAKPGQSISSQHLRNSIDKLSPELRSFAISPEGLAKVDAVGSILDQFNKLPHNFSNTARTVDKLMEYVPGSAIAGIGMLMGHNPVMSGAVGLLAKYLGKDVPDAVRLSLLKFLGSSAPVEAGAFKSMVESIQSVINGENRIARASKNLFKAGKEVLPSSAHPSEAELNKLDKHLREIQKNPDNLLKVADNQKHYMADHSEATGALAARAANYLNGLRPDTAPRSPLDSKTVASTTEKAAYKQALIVAQQPLVVLDKIQKGTVSPQDVVNMQQIYPDLYNKLVTKVTSDMAEVISKGDSVPYKTRIGLSMFLAQPMDSTMTTTGILAAQPKPVAQQAANEPAPGNSKNTAKLGKNIASYRTPNQAAEADRAKRG